MKYFVAKHICEVAQLAGTTSALKLHCDPSEYIVVKSTTHKELLSDLVAKGAVNKKCSQVCLVSEAGAFKILIQGFGPVCDGIRANLAYQTMPQVFDLSQEVMVAMEQPSF
jgi:prophage antirepressor-like protein